MPGGRQAEAFTARRSAWAEPPPTALQRGKLTGVQPKCKVVHSSVSPRSAVRYAGQPARNDNPNTGLPPKRSSLGDLVEHDIPHVDQGDRAGAIVHQFDSQFGDILPGIAEIELDGRIEAEIGVALGVPCLPIRA